MASLRPLWRATAQLDRQCARSFFSSSRNAQENGSPRPLQGLADLLGRQVTEEPLSQSPSARVETATTTRPAAARRSAFGSPARTEGRYDSLRSMRKDMKAAERSLSNEMSEAQARKEWEQEMTRTFNEGDVYAPHDLSAAEARKWKNRKMPVTAAGNVPGKKVDLFDALNVDPLKEYKNFSIMSEYVSDMGRIKHRNITKLRGVNQRRMAKAVRRAIGIGLMPSVHKHPLVINKELHNITGPRRD